MFGHEDWILKIRGREVTARVVLLAGGHGTLTSYQVTGGPSQIGLQVLVESRQDATDQIEALLCKLLGDGWN
ncbi:MAG TPA: hypothetical protein DEA38_02515 [Stenotrophomonas sp.]|nr:hypothetical protein [Stenotrophomonas sp.]